MEYLKYNLINATEKDISRLISYKKDIILSSKEKFSAAEIAEAEEYIKEETLKNITSTQLIEVDKKIIGSLTLKEYKDGLILDEIYIENAYRGMNIGTNLIKKIITMNKPIYLYVYKTNKAAIKLYKNLGFKTIDETKTRLFMKYKER